MSKLLFFEHISDSNLCREDERRDACQPLGNLLHLICQPRNHPMSLFTDWNDLLLNEYFSPASAGEEVWLQTNRQELDSFGLHLGGADGLVEAVRSGAHWLYAYGSNCAEAASQLATQRRATVRPREYVDPEIASPAYSGARAPTYLPILAVWVLASSEGDGFYAKVAELLDQSFSHTQQLTAAMSDAWQDLEQWSSIENLGRFGSFNRRVLGVHQYVGIPKSQCLMSRKDGRGILQLFVACDLRPRQALTLNQLAHLADLGQHAHYLSNSLKRAFGQEMYLEPLKLMLEKVLDSWDGRLPKFSNNEASARSSLPVVSEEVERTTLALVPSKVDADGWDIQWRFRSSGQGNACLMVLGGTKIPARQEPWGNCFSTGAEATQQEACSAMLVRSAVVDVQHEIEFNDKDNPELGGGTRACQIDCHPFRILVWDSPDPRFGELLVERELPISGPFYIACSPNAHMERYLRSEGVECTSMVPRGLPAGWTLTAVLHAERLTEKLRHELSGETEREPSAARLRFFGGRPILRGGFRLYASYDLPIVEMEAPAGAILSAIGIQFEELKLQALRSGAPVKSHIRRFKIQPRDFGRLVFEIGIVESGRVIASARLRISAPEGTGSGSLRSFSIDSLGRSRPDSLGLRGTRLGDGQYVDTPPLPSGPMQVPSADYLDNDLPKPYETISGRFLDSLAQLGSMGYGQARDQLKRLADGAGLSIQPALLLLDLRSRAHLEIQTDNKGHLIRIHSVPPTLYSLPATFDDLPLFGVCGSLRVQHWRAVLEHASCMALTEVKANGRLPALKLAILDGDEAREVARTCDFRFDWMPSVGLSTWAASLEQAKGELSSWGWSSFSAELQQLQRLQPNSAQFVVARTGTMSVDGGTRCQLFRFDDPSAAGLQVHVLATMNSEEATRYSFVHDSRWGVWLSVAAFAQMMREKLSRDDVYPWPIHYDHEKRELWLPARIKPPLILERILALCAGSGPKECQLSGSSDGAQVRLISADSGCLIGGASLVYEAFVPGTWLCYKWVPPEVASRVAALLGGDAKPFERPLSRQEQLTQ